MDPTNTTEWQRAAEKAQRKLPIRTYHCRFCSHLLIASTRELLSSSAPLRRRRQLATGSGLEEEGAGVGGMDGAMILEIPSSSGTRAQNKKRKSYDENQRDDSIPGTTAPAASGKISEQAAQQGEKRKTEQAHYTIPLSTLLPDPTPVVIRRGDGFEKRVLLRCGRCRVVVGYKLPRNDSNTTLTGLAADQGPDEEDEEDEEVEDEDENGVGLSKGGGKGEKVIYLLPARLWERRIWMLGLRTEREVD
uniref:Uncharacterized protein n=1 Tax=Talaromyces marneffei PM1 TaxID=1077442 RepID=A0A093VB25_TALMA